VEIAFRDAASGDKIFLDGYCRPSDAITVANGFTFSIAKS